MRTRALLLCLVMLVGSLPAPATGQSSSTVEVDLTFTLHPDEGTVDVDFQVEDPGQLKTIQLRLGDLDSLEGSPTLEGSWTQEDGVAVADLDASPNARAAWTSNGRITAQTLEGEGHTTYVSEEFSVVKAGDMVPGIRYSYPDGEEPRFDSDLSVEIPNGWSLAGPWSREDGAFQLDRPLPRGFLATGPSLEEVELGSGEQAYRIVRLAGTQEDETTERILLEARSFLGGIYGDTAHERFIVVAPSPMFRGGLGSPAGVFLHDDADANVVAHEMVHAYQGFRFSREPGEATIWLAEGTAVTHGVLLEVAAGVKDRQEARDFLQTRHDRAEDEHAVALTSAVYGSGNEQAAYTKGAVVVTALDDLVRQNTGNQYTLSDVLKELNRRGQASDSFQVDTDGLIDIITEVTGYDAGTFFHDHVYDSDVPPLGSVFPGQVAIRIVSLTPSPPIEGQPFEVEVRVTNLDTQQTSIDVPVTVDGETRGRLTATLEAGSSARAWAEVAALDRGTYEMVIQGGSRTIDVLSPADPNVNVTLWPPEPLTEENVTVGARIANAGEAPYRDEVAIVLDGQRLDEREVDVASEQVRTISSTVPALEAGEHEVRIVGSQGELARSTFTVSEPPPSEAPSPSLAVLVSLIVLAALLGRARARR